MLFGHCLPSKEVLPVRFPEDTRRRTGTGGMVSSTARKEGGSNQIIYDFEQQHNNMILGWRGGGGERGVEGGGAGWTILYSP